MCCVLSWFQLFGSVGYEYLTIDPELGLLVASVESNLRTDLGWMWHQDKPRSYKQITLGTFLCIIYI